jgi:hypothetical protein
VTDAVTISAFANNTANAYAAGGAFGFIAAGAMISDIGIGRGAGVDEITAGVGNGSTIRAGSLNISATGTDTLRSSTIAASGGLVAIAGADSRISSDSASLATIGNNVDISVGSLSLNSVHAQNFDSNAPMPWPSAWRLAPARVRPTP